MGIDVGQELKEIRNLIGSACIMESVRQEVRAALQDGKAMILDGEHAQSRVSGSSGFDVVVIVSSINDDVVESLARRLRARIPDAEIKRIGVDGVLGVRGSRRGSRGTK